MKKLLFTLAISASALLANSGEEIFKANCTACHSMTPPKAMMNPGTPEFEKALKELKAPPMMKVASMIRMKHEGKENFIKFMSDYITNPAMEKTVCMKNAIKGFGLMPAIGKSMSDADKTAVAEWIYDTTKNMPAMDKMKGMKCGQGKCGDAKPKAMKCQAGKCGGNMDTPKAKAMKCQAGKCGGNSTTMH